MDKRESGLAGAIVRLLYILALSLLPVPVLAQGLTQTQTVTASITSGTSITLPAWTPAPNDLILVAVALRDETQSVSVSGNGLTFVQIADLDNAQGQTGVSLFRAMGPAPTGGSITVTIGSGNTLPVVVSATRFAGADASGLHGGGAVEAVAMNAGPPVTDDRNMKINVTTLSPNAWAYAAGTHRLASFTVPPGETAISINNVAGASGDMTTLSTWYEAVPAPGTVTLGADNDLNSARDWAVIAVSIRPAQSTGQALTLTETVTASITSGTSIALPAWTPAPNDLILVAVALRDETRPVSVSGNGLTFAEIANLDNAQGQTGVNLFRAMGPAPTSGSITVTLSGNSLPAIASATRFAGADTSGTNGSGAVEAVATNAGPPVTDDDDMKINITTLSPNAWAYAAGTHRLATFALPSGEIAISINNVAGTSGDMTTLSTWYEAVPTPGTVTLGADNDLSSVRDWAVIAASLRPAAAAGNAAPTVSLTSPANGAAFGAPATIVLAANAQDSDGTVTQVEFFQGATLVATDTTAPYTFTLTNVQPGSYTFTARATDNLGASTTSTAATVTVSQPAQLYFIHADHLNTPRVVTNQAQQVVWRWENQEPFGKSPPEEDPDADGIVFEFNLRFPGQYRDAETGLFYNYFRDYDPQTGRYAQSDPIGLNGGINTYVYGLNDPLVLFDAAGLRVQLNGYVFNNAYVLYNLLALNQEIVNQGIPDECFILNVTGGDRYRDPSGRHRSLTNDQVVPGSDPNSPHLVERGARAVDLKIVNVAGGLCACAPSVNSTIFDNALNKTNFNPTATKRGYSDGHVHINLPPIRPFIQYPPVNP